MATAASSTPPSVSVPAHLSLMHALVSQKSLEPAQAIEKRLGDTVLTLDERVSITMQLKMATGLLCFGEAMELSRNTLKNMSDFAISVDRSPPREPVVFEDAQITRHLEVLRVVWDALIAKETAPKAEVPKGLSSRPLHGYSCLRETDCTLPLFAGQSISRIDFTFGCLTPQASQLCPAVLTMQDMYNEGQGGFNTVVLELQSLTLEQQRGHYSQVLITPAGVVASLPVLLDPILSQPIAAIVQSYLVPTIRPEMRLYLTTLTSTWLNRAPYLFPYAPVHISSTQPATKASGTTVLSASSATAAASAAPKESVASSSSSAGALALPEAVDAAITFPWIQAEIDRIQEKHEVSPRFEGDWIVHDTLWVIACVVFNTQAAILLSHPNMGCALSYLAKEKDEQDGYYELQFSLEVTSGRINPKKRLDEHTSLVTQFAAFVGHNKAKSASVEPNSATAQSQSAPSSGKKDDSKL